MKKTVGIWGAGVVGTATGHLFETLCPNDVNVLYYDKYKQTNATREQVAEKSDFIFVCLPTPMRVTGAICMDYIFSAFSELNQLIRNYNKDIIIRSTSVSGSTDQLSVLYSRMNISFMPEFLTEKNALEDSLNPTRIVIGVNNDSAFERIKTLYQYAFKDTVPYIKMTRREAETYKYVCNVMLAMSVLVSNEIYFSCKELGIDYNNIEPHLKYDARISSFTKVPGHDGDFGTGGKCLIPSTIVRLRSGKLITLEEASVGDEIYDGEGYTTITKIGERNVEETIEIDARGRRLQGSLDHIQIVFDNGNFMEKQFKDIQITDKLFVPIQEAATLSTINIGPPPNKNFRKVWHENVVLNKNIARLIGLYLADGCISDKTTIWSFGEHEEHFADEVKTILSEELGIHSRKHLQISNGTFGVSRCWIVATKSRWLIHFMSLLNTGTNAHTKNCLLLHPDLAEAVIGGWMDGDGHSFKNTVGGFSRSTKWITSIDTMLLSMNILPALGRNGQEIGAGSRDFVKIMTSWTKRHTKYKDSNYVRDFSYASPTFSKAVYTTPEGKEILGWTTSIKKITKKNSSKVISIETQSGRYVANNILTHNCFPKDLNAFIHLVESHGYDPKILKAGNDLNNRVRKNKDWLDIPGAVEQNTNWNKD